MSTDRVLPRDYEAAARAYCRSERAYYPQNFYGDPNGAAAALAHDAAQMTRQRWFRVIVDAAVVSAQERSRETRRAARLARRARTWARWAGRVQRLMAVLMSALTDPDGLLVSWDELAYAARDERGDAVVTTEEAL